MVRQSTHACTLHVAFWQGIYRTYIHALYIATLPGSGKLMKMDMVELKVTHFGWLLPSQILGKYHTGVTLQRKVLRTAAGMF